MSRRTAVAAVACGLALGATLDGLLALLGAASFSGPPLGLLFAPLLLLVVHARRELLTSQALMVIGIAWTCAPLVDQHVLAVVTVEGLALDVLHHTAGWVPLFVGSQLLARPSTPLPTS